MSGTAPHHDPSSRADPAERAPLVRFIVYSAFVLSLLTIVYPPFTSINGTEYAFVLTGPEWSRRIGQVGQDLGLSARIDWTALLVQLTGLWALALGARWYLGRPAA